MLPYDWREKLSINNIRTTINNNSMVVSIVMGVVLIIGIAWIIKANFIKPNYTVQNLFFVDEETGDITVKSAQEIPPLANSRDGKPTVVRAVMFSCGTSCKDKKVAYYEKYSDKLKEAVEKRKTAGPSAPPEDMMLMEMGFLVRLPEKDSPWVPANSPDGFKVTSRIACPEGGQPQICLP